MLVFKKKIASIILFGNAHGSFVFPNCVIIKKISKIKINVTPWFGDKICIKQTLYHNASVTSP